MNYMRVCVCYLQWCAAVVAEQHTKCRENRVFFYLKVFLYAKKVQMGVATAPTLSLESATSVAQTTVRPLCDVRCVL